MEKNYVILVNYLHSIGGAQKYVLRKAIYMKNKGYKVFFITSKDSPILLNGLKNFERLQIPEINIPTYLLKESVLKRRLQIIHSFISDNCKGEIILECTSLPNGTWAELVVQKFGARSFIYEIGAAKPIKEELLAHFAAFKLKRGELIACSQGLFAKMFELWPNLYSESENIYINIPIGTGKRINRDTNTLSHKLIRILSISRLGKPYLEYLIEEIKEYAVVNHEEQIELTVLLNKLKGRQYHVLEKKSSEIPDNLRISFRGPEIPLPPTIFSDYDIFVGMGTAALEASSFGLPSIIAATDKRVSYGFLGLDTFDFGNNGEKTCSIKDALTRYVEDRYLSKVLPEKTYEYICSEHSEEKVMKKFDSVLQEILNSQSEYFNFCTNGLGKNARIRKCLLAFLGVRGYRMIARMFQNLFRTRGYK